MAGDMGPRHRTAVAVVRRNRHDGVLPPKGRAAPAGKRLLGTDKQLVAKWDAAKIPLSHFTEKDPDWKDKFHVWRMDWDEKKSSFMSMTNCLMKSR